MGSRAENPLLEPLGEILDDRQLIEELIGDPTPIPHTTRGHELPYLLPRFLSELFIPDSEVIDLARAIDVNLRESYRLRDPDNPTPLYRGSYSEYSVSKTIETQPLALSAFGISGVGKSTSIDRILDIYPKVKVHETLPGFEGPCMQLVSLHVDVPSTGKLKDLARTLIHASAEVLAKPDAVDLLYSKSASGLDNFERWVAFAHANFLGCLVLDEAQNLFKLTSVARRKTSRSRNELRVADDESLKGFLKFVNTSGIPVVFAGTPDAKELLTNRFAMAQRAAAGGVYNFLRCEDPNDSWFSEQLMPKLLSCEIAGPDRSETELEALRAELIALTGGIPRIIKALWSKVIAHAGVSDVVTPELLAEVFGLRFAELKPAIDAINSGDPVELQKYQDLVSQIDFG